MPPHDCTEKENIMEMKDSIKDLVTEFKSEFKAMMVDLRSILQDSREHRTEIANLKTSQARADAETEEQWRAIEAGKKDLIHGMERLGDRIAGLDTDVQAAKVWQAEQKGQKIIYKFIPIAVAVIATLVSLGLAIHAAFK